MIPSPAVGGTYGAITWTAVIFALCTFARSTAAFAALSESVEPSVGPRMCLYLPGGLLVLLVHHHVAQAGYVEDADVLLLLRAEVLGLGAREEAAHGLERQAQVAADLVARHAKVELA